MADLFEREILKDWEGGTGQLDPPVLSLWQRSRTALFQVLFHYYSSPFERDIQRSSTMRTVGETAVRTYIAVQLLALLILVQADRTQWLQFKWVLQACAFARLDHLAAEFKLEFPFFLFTISVIAAANLSFAYMLLCVSIDKKYGLSIARKAFRLTTIYLKGVGFIPTLCILLSIFKYSTTESALVNEYFDYEVRTFDYDAGGAIASLLALLGCWIVPLHILLVYEQAQFLSKWLPTARAHSRVEVCLYGLLTLTVILLFAGQSEW